ncbi:MAG: mechanosensitive ion channel family protein [Chloroflexi bacterium]|nr:mechanosensitive ion channel family protein [Chloroflexota bacterium]
MDWNPIINWLLEHGPRILFIIAISVAVYYLLRHFVPIVVKRTVTGTMVGKPKSAIKKRTDTLSNVFIQTGMVFVGVVAIFTIVAELGINIAPALAGLGIAGIAVGFGAQSLVKDIFNGVLILLENQYGIGDVVKIAGIAGLVEDVTMRRTVLRDLDGIVHSIPNSEIGVASNYTKEWARVNMNISVGYGENLDHVIEVINRVGKELAEDPDWAPRILKAPQVLRVDDFGDSGIALKILGETGPLAQWDVMGELRLRLKKVFDEEGIEIPWPHIKVFFGHVPEIGIKGSIEQELPLTTPAQQPSKRKRRRKLPPD